MARPARLRTPPVRLVSTHDIMGGRLCVEGTRVPVDIVLANINAGAKPFDLYCDYPSLPHGSYEAVVHWAESEGLPCSPS